MIICVTDRLHCQEDFIERIEKIAKAQPYSIILREKDLQPDEYEKLAVKVLQICDRYNVPLIINSYIDIATRLKVPNIHLSLKMFLDNSNHLKTFNKVGVSVHSVEDAILAESMGANYLIAGHIYATDCKKGVPPRGIDFLKKVCSAVSIPVFAIGGINCVNINDVLKCGAEGVCVMSQLMKCDNPDDVMASYRK